MNKKTVYTYAKFYLMNTIKYYEDKLNKEALTEEEEIYAQKILESNRSDLKAINFDLSLMESKGE